MTREQKDKILIALAVERNAFATDCNRRIAEENGKIMGADYMLQRFRDILHTEVEQKESEENPLDKIMVEIAREMHIALNDNIPYSEGLERALVIIGKYAKGDTE